MEFLSQFHFIRPLWLLALLPLALIAWQLLVNTLNRHPMHDHISEHLLPYLLMGEPQLVSNWPAKALMLFLLMTTIALAGPTWQKQEQPVFQSQSALIIALDLSPSMMAEDVKPSRIKRAQLKIQSLLEERQEGLTALIAYAGEAHVVTPLTDDSNTIKNLLPTLQPGLLPIPGSNIEMAISLANELLQNNALAKAHLLVVTDGIDESAKAFIASELSTNISLSILGIGTERGGTIPTEQGVVRDGNNNAVIAKRNDTLLRSIAQTRQGYYLPMQAGNDDIRLIQQITASQSQDLLNESDTTQQFDQWVEFGPTLLLITLPFAALAFRRGWLLSLLFVLPMGSLTPQTVQANPWKSLWQSQDEQGYEAYQAENYEQAAEAFDSPGWKGSAHYKQGNYEQAIEAFREDPSAHGHYNRGNALAQLQRFDEAIAAYDDALALKPNFTEALDNKKRIQEIKEQEQNSDENPSEPQESEDQENQQNQSSENDSDSNQEQENTDDSSQEQQQNDQNQNANSQAETEAQDNNENDPSATEANEKNTEPDENAEDKNSQNLALPKLSQEEQQAMQQWLQKIPDDPSGLLRNKFEYEFQKRRELYQQGEWDLPENDAHKRY